MNNDILVLLDNSYFAIQEGKYQTALRYLHKARQLYLDQIPEIDYEDMSIYSTKYRREHNK